MKKICFFIDNISHVGGTERVCLLIANELVRCGYEIFILNKVRPDKIFYSISKEISVDYLEENYSGNYLKQILKLRKYLKKNQIDTIIDVDTSFAPITEIARFLLPIKHIAWEHFNAKLGKCSLRQKIGRKTALYFADKLVLLTEADRENYPKNKKNVCVISNPLSFFPDKKAPLKNKQIISIGRFTAQKGFDYLIDAFAKFSNNFPDWKLKIVSDGELRDELTEQINSNNLNNKVELVGFLQDVTSVLQEASIFVMSSRYEGMPMVLLEAMSCGVPVVSFDCPYGPKSIIKENCGILVEPANVSELAAKIGVLASDEQKRIFMGDNARKEVEKYKIENIINKWISII